jgi:uncharacterized protein (DUF58 family)
VSASTVRPFLPEDSLRLVHWRTTARRAELYVRSFENRPSGDWWILLDGDQSVQAGEDASSTLEHAIILAASLADRGLHQSRAVGLAALGQNLAWLPPRPGEGQRWQILHALALLKPGEKPFSVLFDLLKPKLVGGASLILITPAVQGEWLESLQLLLWKGAAPTVLLLDPKSFGGQGQARQLCTILKGQGISSYEISSDLLDRPEAHPGRKGVWEWRVTPSGRAIPLNPPRESTWRGIG